MDNNQIFGELRSLLADKETTPLKVWDLLQEVSDVRFLTEVVIPYCHEATADRSRFPVEFFAFQGSAGLGDLQTVWSDPRCLLITSLDLEEVFLLSDQDFKLDCWTKFTSSPYLTNVKILNLRWNHLTNDHIFLLIYAPIFSHLNSLDLSHNAITEVGRGVLLAHTPLSLTFVEMSFNAFRGSPPPSSDRARPA